MSLVSCESTFTVLFYPHFILSFKYFSFSDNFIFLGSQRNHWQCSKCNSRKNRHRIGNLWNGRDPWEGHAGKKANVRTEITRFVPHYSKLSLPLQNWLFSMKLNQYMRDWDNQLWFYFIFPRESKEKVQQPRRLWRRRWRRWRGGAFDAADGCGPATARLRRSDGSAGNASRGWHTGDASGRIPRQEKLLHSALKIFLRCSRVETVHCI